MMPRPGIRRRSNDSRASQNGRQQKFTSCLARAFNPIPVIFWKLPSLPSTMKRRITYISASNASFDPAKQAILGKDALSIRNLDAAKEERITLGFEELPANV